MKKGLKEVICILDKSGSMQSMRAEVTTGFNKFVQEQKTLNNDIKLTLILFDNLDYVIHDRIDINEIPQLNQSVYVPQGMTAYFDALGRAIDNTGVRLKNTPEDEKPEKVIVMVFTDGEENSSVVYDGKKLKGMIEHQEEIYDWSFMFFGSKIDALVSSEEIGIKNYSNVEFSKSGINAMYSTLSRSIVDYDKTGNINPLPENIS
jgi:uncharacterized protein YegL